MEDPHYIIHSLEAALDVLEGFTTAGSSSLGITEISKITGFNKNRIFRILYTLERRGYVVKNRETLKYSLGPSFLSLIDAASEIHILRRLAEPLLERLASESGDTAFLFVLAGMRAVCVAVREGHHRLQVTGYEGQSLDLHVGASPKLLLAYLPEAERKKILSTMKLTRYTEHTIVSLGELERTLQGIRSRDYSEAIDDFEVGVYAAAIPIRDLTGRVLAALAIAFPRVRDTPERREAARLALVDAARSISATLGFHPEVNGHRAAGKETAHTNSFPQ